MPSPLIEAAAKLAETTGVTDTARIADGASSLSFTCRDLPKGLDCSIITTTEFQVSPDLIDRAQLLAQRLREVLSPILLSAHDTFTKVIIDSGSQGEGLRLNGYEVLLMVIVFLFVIRAVLLMTSDGNDDPEDDIDEDGTGEEEGITVVNTADLEEQRALLVELMQRVVQLESLTTGLPIDTSKDQS